MTHYEKHTGKKNTTKIPSQLAWRMVIIKAGVIMQLNGREWPSGD
jgi:hypothetical protein